MAPLLHIDLANSISLLRAALHEVEIKTKIYYRFSRGKSFDFDGYRFYSSDEDASFIDWKASVRSNRLLVRQYKEESPLTIFFIVDASDRMVFGSGVKLKCEYAAETVLSLAHLLIKYNHRVGLILYNDNVEVYFPAKSGSRHFQRMVVELQNAEHYHGESRIDNALEFALKIFSMNVAGVFLISDFLTAKLYIQRHLPLLAGRFETIAMIVKDPLDRSLPKESKEYLVEDPIGGEQLLVDPSLARQQYAAFVAEQESWLNNFLNSCGVDHVLLNTQSSFVAPVAAFFKGRLEGR